MGRILITTDYLSAGDEVDQLLREHGHEPVYSPYRGERPPNEREDLLRDFDAAILASETVSERMLARADRLKVIARSGVGFDSIDIAAATAHGVRVCNAPGTNHHSVAEMTVGLMVMIARRLNDVVDRVRRGDWPRAAGHELKGAVLGIIGYGPSGRATAQLGLALGMKVLVSTSYPVLNDSSIQFTDLETVISSADYLSLHTRSQSTETSLISEPQLRSMKSSAVLINTARGSLVDEAALNKALENGIIAGAALDVFEVEPLPKNSPLRQRDNLLITSHLGGQTAEARLRAALFAANSVIDVLAGREPAASVNR